MSADSRPSPNWFMYNPKTVLIDGGVPVAPADGYERVLDYARDRIARPHDATNGDKLWAECMEVATLLTRIAVEEGEIGFMAKALEVMILDTVRREVGA